MSIAWSTVENAIVSWVRAGSGLAAGKVYWTQQEGARPAGASIALRLGGFRPAGRDWFSIEELPELEQAPGADHRMLVRGARRAVLTMQAFPAASPASGAQASPSSAVAMLAAVVSARHLPTRIALLSAAKVGVLSFGSIQSVDGILGASFESRAVLEVQLAFAAEVSELGTTIETVEITNEMTGDEFVVP